MTAKLVDQVKQVFHGFNYALEELCLFAKAWDLHHLTKQMGKLNLQVIQSIITKANKQG